MPTIQDAAAVVRDELDQLKADFASALRALEGIGSRIETASQKVISLHKQANNAAQPNPEVNATNPPAATPTTTG